MLTWRDCDNDTKSSIVPLVAINKWQSQSYHVNKPSLRCPMIPVCISARSVQPVIPASDLTQEPGLHGRRSHVRSSGHAVQGHQPPRPRAEFI